LSAPTILLAVFSSFIGAIAADQTVVLPPVHLLLKVDDQAVVMVVSGSVTKIFADRDRDVFRVALNADLGGLQDNITRILQAELNKNDRCGERLSIEQATLVPAAPSGTLTTSLHFEKWACIKAFHKDMAKRLAGGNGTAEVRLTPEVRDGDAVRLKAELGAIQADGSIGEMLQSPTFADALREKIAKALDKVQLEAAIPPALQGAARIEDVSFADAGGGRLTLRIRATVTIPARDAKALMERLAALPANQPAAPAR
jgi:hypothetical protein